MDHTTLLLFAKYIETEVGIIYAEHNFFQLQRRLEDIAALMSCSESDLCAQAQAGISQELKGLLLDTATNNETSFFRDPRVFSAIEHHVLPLYSELNGCFKVWSAASSTGQEALSIAMLIHDFNEQKGRSLAFSIFASDISERVLQKAKNARYSKLEVSRGLQLSQLQKYFRETESGDWAANPELIKTIEFKRVNLKEPFSSLDRFHLVFCRNVLIYQSVEGKRGILSRIADQMEPGGFLVLGAGEALLGISDEFDSVQSDGVILYRKKPLDPGIV